ncbi:MAG: carboxylesterase family protein [Gammaproteobacteria bacterium]|nr:MAG: carboxylesterase family protein [Gammaproteobacteria bacterium]TLZ49944.1 MAG: carboxylesterase family protein [Gammaproteobacteria bacterium]
MKNHQNNAFASRAPRRAMTRALLLGSVLAAGVLSTSATAQEGDERADGPVVQTSEGPVRGFVRDGVYEFLGIPYAAPPVGALRWMPPQPVAHWREPLKATKFANTCAQVTELGVFAGPPNINEDCLYLNVFTTRLGGEERGNAVLVWIHGGGNVDGESNDYDGSKLATGGPLGTPTVVVTLNYRLGLFGFLAHPALDSEGHLYDNYGIMDQQAVLQWVKRNAAAFGGDPSRVALGGQSAGAQDTGVNQISPLSAGLFNRAIYESSPLSGITIRSIGLARGMAFASAAGCPTDASPGAAACLRALSAAEILQLQGTPNVTGPYVTGPMLDGTIMPITPITAWRTGQFNRMPIMGGNVQDESTFGISITEYFANPHAPITETQYVSNVTATYSGAEYSGGPNYPADTVAKVLAKYPPNFMNLAPQEVFDLVGTHPGACRNVQVDRLWAKWVPVYEYEFNDQNAPYYFPPLPGFKPLAAHTIDIQFLFPNWHGGVLGVNHPATLTAQETALSDELVAAWTHFASTGNPNGTGNSPWPQYSEAANAAAVLSENVPSLSTFTLAQWSANHNCDLWTGDTLDPITGNTGGILHFQP